MIVLSPQERVRFAAWLRQEAATNELIANQSSTLDGLEVIVKRYRSLSSAALVLAAELDRIEEDSI